ncbi:MAG TPA: class I SAM-dependent methyltransferase [Acidimicrobiales bacterium]|nr:class I SAM-dependent methyltransferase [Acidimicrobiales bacterium]
MTWEEWRWDPTLFEGTAPHYLRGRLPYAPGIADVIADQLALDGSGRLLDVGCGPGIVASLLADRFEEVVGVDPDPGMIAEAERLALSNARWVQLRAEDLEGASLDTFRAVCFGASFHWMDRPRVAAIVRDLLDPGGAVVQVSTWNVVPLPEAVEGLRVRYLGPDRRAGGSIRNTSPDGEDAVFQAAGFAPMVEIAVPDGREVVRSVDDVVANVLSMSGTAPHLFGDRLDDFVAELRSALRQHAPYRVTLGDNAVRIWRKG